VARDVVVADPDGRQTAACPAHAMALLPVSLLPTCWADGRAVFLWGARVASPIRASRSR